MEIYHWSTEAQTQLCRDILKGLGFKSAREFKVRGLAQSFRKNLVRESSDGLFRTDENWHCVFEFPRRSLDEEFIDALIQGTIAANVQRLLLVVFGIVPPELEADLRVRLGREQIHTVVFAGELATVLAKDYGTDSRLETLTVLGGFSFARLRKAMQAQVEEAPWRKYFQTASIQPARLLPLHRGKKQEESLTEADLFRAMQQGSLLLLGEPGAGKTTTLLAVGQQLATQGGLMPLFLPLGRYQGDFGALLAEALAAGDASISQQLVKQLLESGGVVLLLDGVNEVQDSELQEHLIQELNRLTEPEALTKRGLWVVSGRVQDYEQIRYRLTTLEQRRWEMQPFTADLIYQLLVDALGKDQGLSLYQRMGKAVRQICANPLLLTMVLGVYQQKGHAPVGRGAIYRQFIELLLQWGQERHLDQSVRQQLQEQWEELLTQEYYQELVETALTQLARAMLTTHISWSKGYQQVATSLASARNPEKAAGLFLQDLTQRGLLRRDNYNRLWFHHHTFQEYFLARAFVQRRVEELIPKGGVPATQRESVIFAAGLMTDPNPLLQRALVVDIELAFEIFRDAPETVSSAIQALLAKRLWERVQSSGSAVGAQRRKAQSFQSFALLSSQNEKTLASQIDQHLSQQQQIERLMCYYRELGDPQAQRHTLEQVVDGKQVPEGLLFDAALAAQENGDYKVAIDHYTRYIETHPSSASAYNNRGICHKKLKHKQEALADSQLAVKLGGSANNHCNLATLLWDLDRKKEAKERINIALKKDLTFASAHSHLADWIEIDEPETALQHREFAVRYAPHDEDLQRYLTALATLQEKQGYLAAALRSLRQLIELDPTSSLVRSRKAKIAKLRQALDAENRTRSTRQRLQEQDELPLPVLVSEWLRAAGLQMRLSNSIWVVSGQGVITELPIALLTAPMVTAYGLRETFNLCIQTVHRPKQVLIVTVAESLTLEARHQLAALQDECQVALVTALEVRDALLISDRECRVLFDRALQRAEQVDNPFTYKGIVQEQTEFFGRVAELDHFTQQIGRGQSIGLYGIHKIGKSSLLAQLRRKLHINYPQVTPVQLELNDGCKTAQDFYRQVLESLPEQSDGTIFATLTAQSFRQRLAQYHQRREQHRRGHRLLLVLDEYAYLIPDRQGRGGIQDFLEVLGVLKTMLQEHWLQLLPCGRTASLSRQASWGNDENPFVDLLQVQFLNPMPLEETNALLETLGYKAGLRFTPEALEIIYQETAGHPSFSRNLGAMLIPDGKGEVTPERVQRAVTRLLNDRDQKGILLAIYESRLDHDEQTIARQVALNPCSKKALFPEDAEIDRRRQIRDALANLIDTTVLVEQEDGTIAHRYGLLRRVIQQQAEELGL
jgi:tetratricopeptide (TPR) repeat protein